MRCLLGVVALVVVTAGCDGGGGFEPRPGVSGRASLQNQSDLSGVLVRVVSLDSVAVTDSTGAFSFEDIPDGRWRVEASYPYFETDAAEVEVRDGLQRNAVRFSLRQLLRFWVELPDTLVSFCKCERSFDFAINGFVENLTRSEVTVASGSTPLRDFAVIPESEESLESPAAVMTPGCYLSGVAAGQGWCLNAYDPCRTYSMILPGDLTKPGSVTLEPRETRMFEISARVLTECYEDGRYNVFWALADRSHHPEHYVYMEPELNWTLLKKPDLETTLSA